jgi:hypothetical protein
MFKSILLLLLTVMVPIGLTTISQAQPTPSPTIKPSVKPSLKPSVKPTVKPSVKPTPSPTRLTTPTHNITGTWNISVVESGRKVTCIFNQTGNTLTGTMKGLPFGDLPVTGTISNEGKVAFSGKMRGKTLSFEGNLEGRSLKGTADFPNGRKSWTATQ